MHLTGISPTLNIESIWHHHLFLPCRIPMLSWIFCPFRVTNYNLNITSPTLDECAYPNMKNIKDDKDEEYMVSKLVGIEKWSLFAQT